MDHNERRLVIIILTLVAGVVTFDLITDTKEGVIFWHVLIEGTAGLAAIFGLFYFAKGSFGLKQKLINENLLLKKEALEWKTEAHKHIEGLSTSIDLQLTKWKLSAAEKEVALLLLKGLSLKEVAALRNTTEKTARVQSIAIYSKSGLAGRSEFAAFFLEDLLSPKAVDKALPSPGLPV